VCVCNSLFGAVVIVRPSVSNGGFTAQSQCTTECNLDTACIVSVRAAHQSIPYYDCGQCGSFGFVCDPNFGPVCGSPPGPALPVGTVLGFVRNFSCLPLSQLLVPGSTCANIQRWIRPAVL
jgi:hypothetical protein